MAKDRVKSPAEFVRSYKVDLTMSHARRYAVFLTAAADAMPYRYIPKTLIARVVFALSRSPAAESPYVKRDLGKISGTARRILWDEHKRKIFFDRMEGVRASYDDNDLAVNADPKDALRAHRALEKALETNQAIDRNNLTPENRRAVLARGRGLKQMKSGSEILPRLPEPPSKKKK